MKKILISLSIIGIVAGISLGVTGAWWSDSATSHNASFHSGTMDLKLANSNASGNPTGEWQDNVNQTWDYQNMVPGGDSVGSNLWLKNVGTTPADWLKFTAKTASDKSGLDKVMRITKLAYAGKNLLTGGAGADLSNYVAPTYCDVTVDPSVSTLDTIGKGVAAASTGQTVCVKPGNYNNTTWHESFPIAISNGITLVSLEGPDTTTITAPADKNAIEIAANNVTIKGFTITGAAYGINTGGHTGITVTDNKIMNYSKEGIWIDGGSATIANNVIKANDNGTPNNNHSVDSIYIKNGAVATIDHNNLENNKYSGTIYNGNNWSTAAGIAAHTGSNVTATYNVITGNDFGIQIKERGVTMTANHNDILGNTRDFFFEANNGCTPVKVFDVTNNWWGDFNPADQVSVDPKCTNPISDIVSYTPYAGGPFIGYINGVDYNHNGFADLNDFYGVTQYRGNPNRAPIVIKNPELGLNQQQKLELYVQLDGPTSNNNQQGGKVELDVTAVMGQGPAE